jgi:poly [ADP-ribose] polymerase
MPLGKLSKAQIVKGFEVLDEIKQVLDKKSTAGLTELSNRFYTVVPHDFGRQRPTIINTPVSNLFLREAYELFY